MFQLTPLWKGRVGVVLQVFDNTPAAQDATLAAGDEITGVNGKPVKGKTKVEVAKMIQAVQVWGGDPSEGLSPGLHRTHRCRITADQSLSSQSALTRAAARHVTMETLCCVNTGSHIVLSLVQLDPGNRLCSTLVSGWKPNCHIWTVNPPTFFIQVSSPHPIPLTFDLFNNVHAAFSCSR